MDPFVTKMDGISDMSYVVSGLVTFIGNVLTNRVLSISQYLGADNLSALANGFIRLIPDEIHLPGTDLYLEGGINDNLTITSDYIDIPLDFSVQNKSRTTNTTNIANFADFPFQNYEVQLFLSDYLFRSMI